MGRCMMRYKIFDDIMEELKSDDIVFDLFLTSQLK